MKFWIFKINNTVIQISEYENLSTWFYISFFSNDKINDKINYKINDKIIDKIRKSLDI